MFLCRLYWKILRLTYPWVPLGIRLWYAMVAKGEQRNHAQICAWVLLTKINFANLLAIAIELAQPEFWV